MIDNFNFVEDNLLQFDKEGEFYMAMVLRRRKDITGKVTEGVNEDNRLIKHYFIYDKEYLKKKADAIRALCEQNNARAYILPQRRTCSLVLWNLHDKISETLKNGSMNVHFDHLIRTSVAGMHETPVDGKWHKRWVLDLDEDEFLKSGIGMDIAADKNKPISLTMFVTYLHSKLRESLVGLDGVRSGEAIDFIPNVRHHYTNSDITVLPTPHGYHIVTPPFTRDERKMEQFFGLNIPKEWIKPDAMALLYAPSGI